MFPIIFLLFLVLPIAELALLIKTGSAIGVWNTILLTIVISSVGAALSRYQGMRVMIRIQENLNRGVMPSSELLDGCMIFAGGVLLMTPGFISDCFGLFLLFPLTRQLIKFFIRKKLEVMLKQGQIMTFTQRGNDREKDYNDIDIN